MAGTTINPYRFGGQLGYRRDGPNRLYIQERHLTTPNARWISRDPLSVAEADFNFYWYVKNDPANYIDPSGQIPIKSSFGPIVLPPPPYSYDPVFWNSPTVESYNNCYAYILNYPCGRLFLYPGQLSGSKLPGCTKNGPSCKNMLINARQDGLINVPAKGCPSGWHKVILFAGPPGPGADCVWHWYRQDPSGTWSNKDGDHPATNCYLSGPIDFLGDIFPPFSNRPITNPSQDAPLHGTPVKCGTLCASNKPVKTFPNPGPKPIPIRPR